MCLPKYNFPLTEKNASNEGPSEPDYITGPPSARQRNAIQMAIRWRAEVGPLLDAHF